MSKATQHTLKLLRDKGYAFDIVERWLPRGKDNAFGNRHDMFGYADIVAMQPGRGLLAVQSTTVNGLSKHRKDILGNELAREWIECGGRLFLIAWEKVHPRTKAGKASKSVRWKERVEEIKLKDFGITEKGGGG